MSPRPQPERTFGQKCGAMISRGPVGYPCTLAVEHRGVPVDDPEPCYAVEVPASVRAWEAWHERHANQIKAQPLTDVFALDCERQDLHARHMWSDPRGIDYVCGGVATEDPFPPLALEDGSLVRGIEVKEGFNGNAGAEICGAASADRLPMVRCSYPPHLANMKHSWQAEAMEEAEVPMVVGHSGQTYVEKRCGEAVVGGIHPSHLHYRDIGVLGSPLVYCPGVEAPEPPAPTKQREGDQVLPTGDESVVDDQALLIADIEERRQVGIERYGQGHRPFNGRNTIQDFYEEMIDGSVYARSLLRLREATREDLAKAVLTEVQEAVRDGFWDADLIAESITNRVLDYVTVRLAETAAPVEAAPVLTDSQKCALTAQIVMSPPNILKPEFGADLTAAVVALGLVEFTDRISEVIDPEALARQGDSSAAV